MASVTKIGRDEASKLVEGYEATKSDATSMVGISKEFVNTYLSSGRKLPLGGREKANFALSEKTVPRTEKTYQRRVDSGNGEVTWEPGKKIIPEHKGLKARSSCRLGWNKQKINHFLAIVPYPYTPVPDGYRGIFFEYGFI